MGTPNIILITIDSLRVDHLGCYGYSRDTSPNINKLASKGVLFLQAVSNGGSTPDAFPSILASLQPLVERTKRKAISPPSITLAELLKKASYQTAAFHSNPHVSRFYGYERGFDTFIDGLGSPNLWKGLIWMRTKARTADGLTGRALGKLGRILKPITSRLERPIVPPIVTAREITNQALSWLSGQHEKFFLWLHYMDVHHPYLPAPEYLSQFRDQPVSQQSMITLFKKIRPRSRNPGQLSPLELSTLIDLYDADIRYVDDTIGSLLDHLGSDLANTIVVVTADHGDEFGEHGSFSHQSVYDEVIRVPLIIAGPGIKSGTIVNHQVSLLDLAPTVADLVGIDAIPSFQGKSLLPVIRGAQTATQATISIHRGFDWKRRLIAYRIPAWKYIRTESLDEANTVLSEELYDLRNDPQERHNLHGSENEEARAFELSAIDKILEFKRLKSEGKTAYEKERIKAKFKKLPKL